MAATAVLLQTLGNGVLWDQFGNALNGHSVYVYARGTTTQVSVYPTSTLSGSPLTQPVSTGSWVVPGSGATQPTPGAIPGYVAGEQTIDFYDSSASPPMRVPAEPLNVTDLIGSDGKIAGPGSLGVTGSVENAQSVAAGNMGSTYALTLAVGDTLLTGTLNTASCTITPAGPAGSSATLHLTQDVTGGRLVVVSGAKTPNGAGITLSSAGSKTDVVVVWTPDGVNFYAQAGGLAFA